LQPLQVLSREKHAYLKVIKSINSANAKQVRMCKR